MGLANARVPAILASSIVCLALGAGSGVAGMYILGYRVKPTETTERDSARDDERARMMYGGGGNPGMPGAPGGGGGGMGKLGGGMGQLGGFGGMMGGGGGMGGGMGGGGRGPASKNQLAALVSKLDQLTAKPLAVTLTDEQRTQLAEQLAGLAEMKELGEEEAKKRLDAALKVIEGQRETLEAAGYRWPGGGGGGFQRPPDDPNPFTTKENGERLKALQERLAPKKAT